MIMDGLQITYLLSLDEFTSKYFKGFGMRDTQVLPKSNARDALYILNTDISTGAGEHWCAVFCKGSSVEFYDPLGMSPAVYDFNNLLARRGDGKIVYNPIMIQDINSKACGHHCLFYAFFRCRGISMKDIIQKFDPKNTIDNDRKAIQFVTQFGKIYAPMDI